MPLLSCRYGTHRDNGNRCLHGRLGKLFRGENLANQDMIIGQYNTIRAHYWLPIAYIIHLSCKGVFGTFFLLTPRPTDQLQYTLVVISGDIPPLPDLC